ncbi:hypothetical protein J6590_036698 [Homalodisca vitripennis]|nr:hypothetical protein J6590_036698 [Homalodisca vitripennis]
MQAELTVNHTVAISSDTRCYNQTRSGGQGPSGMGRLIDDGVSARYDKSSLANIPDMGHRTPRVLLDLEAVTNQIRSRDVITGKGCDKGTLADIPALGHRTPWCGYCVLYIIRNQARSGSQRPQRYSACWARH